MSELADFCLCFPDEPTALAAAQDHGAVAITEDGPRLVRFTERYAIDVIGIISTPGTYDDQGNELTSPVALSGWHANFRILDGTPLPDSLSPYVVTPVTPYRVWA